MTATMATKGFIGIRVLMALLYVYLGIDNAFFNLDGDAARRLGPFWAAMVGLVPAAVILGGLWGLRRWPGPGSALVLAGAVPLGLLLFWTVVTPILAALLVAAWFGARRFAA